MNWACHLKAGRIVKEARPMGYRKLGEQQPSAGDVRSMVTSLLQEERITTTKLGPAKYND